MALNTAVVGAGVVSGVHLTGLQECPRTNLVAVCDIDEQRARDVARERGITPYFDLDAMLAEESLDWVHVCTSVQSHLPLAKTAFEHGVPVLVEKPVTESVSEYEQLVAAADESGVPFSVVHNHRYDPVMRAARDRIADGGVGAIRGVDLVYTGLTPPDDHHRGSWVFDLPGGEFGEGLPHPLYLAIDAAGYPASEAAISVQTSLFGEYEQGFAYDSAQVQYVSESDTLCSITMLSGDVSQRVLRIHGERRTLVVDLISQTLSTFDKDYTNSRVGMVQNSTDRMVGMSKDTVKNVVAFARGAFADDWESTRTINPQFFQYDVEARALQRGEHPDPEARTRARWTVTLLEAIRTAATEGKDADSPESEEVVDDTSEEVVDDTAVGDD